MVFGKTVNTRKSISWSFWIVMWPPKSICISSLGSEQLNKGFQFDAGITGLRFLPISVQRLHWAALLRISRCMYGQNAYCPRIIIPQLPEWKRWRISNTASWIECGIATRSSTQTQPKCTCGPPNMKRDKGSPLYTVVGHSEWCNLAPLWGPHSCLLAQPEFFL